MSFGIKVFEKGTAERELLEKAASALTSKSPNGWRYYVGETYFDFGQNWKWTTVICDNGGFWGGYQALSPRTQEMVLMSDGSDESMSKIADEVLGGKFCPDRVKEAV